MSTRTKPRPTPRRTDDQRQPASRADQVALTDIIRSIRPDWDRWLIESILQSHAHRFAMGDLARAAINWAMDPTSTTPKGIVWAGSHWRGLDTQPDHVNVDLGPRCSTCDKPEGRCLTERPGPDDHPFEPKR